MKIVLIGSRKFDSFEYHIGDSLQTLGHAVVPLDLTDVWPVSPKFTYWTSRFLAVYDRAISLRLATKTVACAPDLILVVYRTIHPVLVDELKKRLPNVPVVQLNPDALSNLEKQQIIAADFDYYFSKDQYIVDFLRHKAGLNAYYLPEGFNPRIHKRPAIEKEFAEQQVNVDVLVFGGIYAYRARMIEQLMRAGIQVAVFGTKGPYLRPLINSSFRKKYLIGEEKNRLLYGARLVFNNFHYAEITSVNQKYFEINGIGGFQLCDYKPVVDEYTGVPAERVTYRTMDEAIDKIRYYLVRPQERYELAEQQYKHFQHHHTIDIRMNEMLNVLSENPVNL